MLPRVKICCISSVEEARMAIRAGASALGLVGAMPSGPGVIADTTIATIALSTPPPIATFLLTSETTASAIIDHVRRVRTNTVQLVDMPEPGAYARLREALPGIKIVQVLHVLDERQIDDAQAVASEIDALLLDSGNPTLSIKELGGTGRIHNWLVSRRIVEAVTVPVFLAGGLSPANVRQAIETVQPFGLDLCSGVRTNGQLDPAKLDAFFRMLDA